VHLGLVEDDNLTAKAPILSRYPNFEELLATEEDEALSIRLRQAESIGRPLGDDTFLAHLETQAGRPLKPAKRGRRPTINAPSP
jgi:putative transposase